MNPLHEYFKKNFEAHPKDAFNDLRKAVALAFKDNKDIETYKDDLKKIDIMEDTYDTRLIIMKDEDLALGKEFLPKKNKK